MQLCCHILFLSKVIKQCARLSIVYIKQYSLFKNVFADIQFSVWLLSVNMTHENWRLWSVLCFSVHMFTWVTFVIMWIGLMYSPLLSASLTSLCSCRKTPKPWRPKWGRKFGPRWGRSTSTTRSCTTPSSNGRSNRSSRYTGTCIMRCACYLVFMMTRRGA